MTKRILVTGGEGYIGGRIVQALSEKDGFEVLSTSSKKECSSSHYYDLTSDVNIFEKLEPIDVVIHLASVNEIICSKDPSLAVEVNTLGSFKLINNAIKAGVGKIIYFSTAHVYGAPLIGEINESCPTRSTHPYSYTHRAVEDYIFSGHDKGLFDGVVIRLSNSFGPPVDPKVNRWSLLVNDLCRQAITDKKLVLKSSGLQRRDFLTLTDVCRAVGHFIDANRELIGDGLYNVGGDNDLQVYEMAKIIQKRAEHSLGYCPEIIRPEPTESDKSERLNFSISKLRSTGFELTNELDKEIDELLLFCKKHFS